MEVNSGKSIHSSIRIIWEFMHINPMLIIQIHENDSTYSAILTHLSNKHTTLYFLPLLHHRLTLHLLIIQEPTAERILQRHAALRNARNAPKNSQQAHHVTNNPTPHTSPHYQLLSPHQWHLLRIDRLEPRDEEQGQFRQNAREDRLRLNRPDFHHLNLVVRQDRLQLSEQHLHLLDQRVHVR